MLLPRLMTLFAQKRTLLFKLSSNLKNRNTIDIDIVKGQLILKKIVKPRILPKNERMNSFLLVCDVFSFVFWENPRPEKNVSRFTDLYLRNSKIS